MDIERINNIVASTYLKLFLEYSAVGIGNKTDKGILVTQEVLDIFQERLQKYLIKLKEK